MVRRDDSDNYDDDPEADVRNRVINQIQADPVESPVYDTPAPPPPPPANEPSAPAPAPAAPPPPVYTPQVQPTQLPASDPNSLESLAAINRGLGFPNFDPRTGKNADGTTVVGPNGDLSHESLPTGGGGKPAPTAAYLKSLIDGGMSPQQAVALFNQQTGRTTGNEAVYYANNQTVGLPEAYLAGGSGGWNIVPRMPEGNRAASAGRPAAAGAQAPSGFQMAGGASAPGAFSSSSSGGMWDPAFTAQLRTLLMSRLQAANSPVDENDESIRAPLTAARNEATRHTDKERTDLAEHLYAQGGLNTDAIGQKIQQSAEQNAQGVGSLRAQLISRELQSRRDEMKDLLQMALASGDAQSARDIQIQMAMLDAQLKREGMDLDAGKYAAYLNQQSALAGLG